MLAINLAQLGVVVAGTWWFAGPAFVELVARGYGSSPEAFAMPELHPIMRLLIRTKVPSLAASAFPGQCRLEFNMALRLYTGFSILWFAVGVFSIGYEAIKGERRRDTWLGLIATPLTAREILRGKAFGAIWKVRWGALMLVAPWTVGLLAGAMHPLGYLAAVVLLAALGVFFAHLGLLMALQEWNPETQAKASAKLVHLPFALVGSVLLLVGPIVLAWASLLTFEDVAAAIRSGPFPELREGWIAEWIGARGAILALFGGIGALAFGAWWLDRKNERGFDKAVGRPVLPEVAPVLEVHSSSLPTPR